MKKISICACTLILSCLGANGLCADTDKTDAGGGIGGTGRSIPPPVSLPIENMGAKMQSPCSVDDALGTVITDSSPLRPTSLSQAICRGAQITTAPAEEISIRLKNATQIKLAALTNGRLDLSDQAAQGAQKSIVLALSNGRIRASSSNPRVGDLSLIVRLEGIDVELYGRDAEISVHKDGAVPNSRYAAVIRAYRGPIRINRPDEQLVIPQGYSAELTISANEQTVILRKDDGHLGPRL